MAFANIFLYLFIGEIISYYLDKYNYFKVSIINISENFYVEISNDYNRDKLVYQYKDTQDGVITFDWKNLDKVTTFTVKVKLPFHQMP